MRAWPGFSDPSWWPRRFYERQAHLDGLSAKAEALGTGAGAAVAHPALGLGAGRLAVVDADEGRAAA